MKPESKKEAILHKEFEELKENNFLLGKQIREERRNKKRQISKLRRRKNKTIPEDYD